MFEGANGLGYSYKLTFIFPENIIKLIDNSAFIRNYQALQEIAIPDSVIGIGAAAFQQAEGLKTVKFGENSKLEYIGNYAFSYCPISEITIPASVTYLGTKPFGDSLTTVTYLGTSPNVISHSGNVFPSAAKTLILPNVENPKLEEWKNFLGGNFTTVKQK